jgi:hypothetical protein
VRETQLHTYLLNYLSTRKKAEPEFWVFISIEWVPNGAKDGKELEKGRERGRFREKRRDSKDIPGT